MGLALETIVGYVASLTGTTTYDPLTNNANQSFVVRSYEPGSWAYIEDIWTASTGHPTLVSIKSPRLHDDVLGIQLAGFPLLGGLAAAYVNPQTLLPGYLNQKLYSTDTLSVTANGTASDPFLGVFNVRYENLGGVSARLYDWPTVKANIANLVGIEVDCTASGTVGVLGPGQALNATTARFKANTDYAWLGYTMTHQVGAVVMNGVDVGNLSVGGPGAWNLADTGSFFVDQSVKYGIPHIPVINSLNVGGTFVSVADIIASTATKVTLLMAELTQRMGTPS